MSADHLSTQAKSAHKAAKQQLQKKAAKKWEDNLSKDNKDGRQEELLEPDPNIAISDNSLFHLMRKVYTKNYIE